MVDKRSRSRTTQGRPSSRSPSNDNNIITNSNLNSSTSTSSSTMSSSSSSSSSSTTSLLDQHLEIAVQEAEKAFIRGDFRQALKDANRCLVYAQQQQSSSSSSPSPSSSSYSLLLTSSSQYYTNHIINRSFDHEEQQQYEGDGSFCVNVPFYFSRVFGVNDDGNHPPLYIRIDSKPADLTDRAAAVALQSWYELDRKLSRMTTVQNGGDMIDNEDAALLTCSAVAREDHLRLLQPFWKTYSANVLNNNNNNAGAVDSSRLNTPRSCSLELVLVLIQFCQATSHVHEAFELALATLDHIFLSADGQVSSYLLLRDQRLIVQELVVHLLCNMLPFCANARAVDAGLRRFSEQRRGGGEAVRMSIGDQQQLVVVDKKEADEEVALQWQLSDRMNGASTRIVLRFLESPPVHWPDECKSALEICQLRLEENFRKNYREATGVDFETNTGLVGASLSASSASPADCSDLDFSLVALEGPTALVPVSGIREASGRFSILPTLGWDGSMEQWLFRLIYLARICAVEPLVLSERRWINRSKLAVSVWSFWFAWRQRLRLYRGSKLVLRMLLKPLQEIVEALLPTRR